MSRETKEAGNASNRPGRFAQARKAAMVSEARFGNKPGNLRENKPVMLGLVLSVAVALACAAFVVALGRFAR